MENTAPVHCRRCGKCCFANLIAYVTADDMDRWEKEDRQDILHVIENQEAIWAGNHFVSAKDGHYLHSCPFIKRETAYYTCTIYETRPRVCRDYPPGSSELCPLYYKK